MEFFVLLSFMGLYLVDNSSAHILKLNTLSDVDSNKDTELFVHDPSPTVAENNGTEVNDTLVQHGETFIETFTESLAALISVPIVGVIIFCCCCYCCCKVCCDDEEEKTQVIVMNSPVSAAPANPIIIQNN
ncbi:uncharacterized protein LOC129229973 isoform X2 [Uloborus diversus]|uniref:uncharacterized protein LOC129229973 isoform X2 n=1 Tax=Uloborus diversus TaxID=327109 RepID=UPI00240903D8|nr:uncharacterized protein LOC129229973 isoform X2 [Uloborus diversus]